ncbi:phage tail protein [Magnetospirillum sulfuroxidans]|uniref:Tail fiber protein n=1 Tax=Magnetospirillum sulfuroxidans TaxID=611300 RepID=A0ABS5IC25_9PROT|nr:tail fiber protein [Magnetospirillum sulfuroxidans]MBR9971303.1 tail fiber protein [Magnetospirillum sulfuroxidans]
MDSYCGEIIFFAGNYAPENFMLCNGMTVSITQYSALFSLIGTTYGGDGVNTIALPDLRARIPVGMGQRTGSSFNYSIGTKFGACLVSLSTANIPAHTHTMLADASGQPGMPSPQNAFLTGANEGGTGNASCYLPSTTPSVVAMAPQTLSQAGGVANPSSIINLMPTMALTAMICVQGLYPNRP